MRILISILFHGLLNSPHNWKGISSPICPKHPGTLFSLLSFFVQGTTQAGPLASSDVATTNALSAEVLRAVASPDSCHERIGVGIHGYAIQWKNSNQMTELFRTRRLLQNDSILQKQFPFQVCGFSGSHVSGGCIPSILSKYHFLVAIAICCIHSLSLFKTMTWNKIQWQLNIPNILCSESGESESLPFVFFYN